MNKNEIVRKHPNYFRVYENSAIISQMWDNRVIFVTTPDDQVAQCIFAEEKDVIFFRSVLEVIFYTGNYGLTMKEGPSLPQFLEKIKADLGIPKLTIISYVAEDVKPKEEWETSAVYHDCMYGNVAIIQKHRDSGSHRISVHQRGCIAEFTQVSDWEWRTIKSIISSRAEHQVVREINKFLGGK